ncbi:MAG TPA: glycine zipper domain-containing protein [Usitatibacter sp.]|nr:glycine zipper domain-containing protein [Usitatibacter sp.]
MTTIIAGGFDVYSKTQAALERLRAAGVAEEYICEFRVNPAGEHDQTPIGGDRHKSPGSEDADEGAVKGAAIGAAIGTAAGVTATPFLGPAGIVAGAAVGGYTGSLVGSLKEESDEPRTDHADVRPAEAMIAVNADASTLAEEDIVRILEECGAHQVERTDGTWANGEWADFDPVSRPQLIGGKDYREHRAR